MLYSLGNARKYEKYSVWRRFVQKKCVRKKCVVFFACFGVHGIGFFFVPKISICWPKYLKPEFGHVDVKNRNLKTEIRRTRRAGAKFYPKMSQTEQVSTEKASKVRNNDFDQVAKIFFDWTFFPLILTQTHNFPDLFIRCFQHLTFFLHFPFFVDVLFYPPSGILTSASRSLVTFRPSLSLRLFLLLISIPVLPAHLIFYTCYWIFSARRP